MFVVLAVIAAIIMIAISLGIVIATAKWFGTRAGNHQPHPSLIFKLILLCPLAIVNWLILFTFFAQYSYPVLQFSADLAVIDSTNYIRENLLYFATRAVPKTTVLTGFIWLPIYFFASTLAENTKGAPTP